MTIQAGHDHSWAEDMDEVRACCPSHNPLLAATGIRCPGETEPDGAPDVKVWTRKISTSVRTYRWVPAAEVDAYLADVDADPDREVTDENEEG